jgi:hypothetical protein
LLFSTYVMQGDPSSQLLLELPDSFARLLVHGLAQFHGLQSTTQCAAGGQKSVVLQCKHSSSAGDGTNSSTVTALSSSPVTQAGRVGDVAADVPSIQAGMGVLHIQQQQQQQVGAGTGGGSSGTSSSARSEGQAAAEVESASLDASSTGGGAGSTPDDSAAASGAAAAAAAAAAAEWLSQSLDITCTDIVMALQELGDNSLNHHSLQDYIRTVHSLSPCAVGC